MDEDLRRAMAMSMGDDAGAGEELDEDDELARAIAMSMVTDPRPAPPARSPARCVPFCAISCGKCRECLRQAVICVCPVSLLGRPETSATIMNSAIIVAPPPLIVAPALITRLRPRMRRPMTAPRRRNHEQ